MAGHILGPRAETSLCAADLGPEQEMERGIPNKQAQGWESVH